MAGTMSIGESFSEPKTTPVFSWDQAPRFFNPVARNFRSFVRTGRENDQLYRQWRDDYLGNSANARDNSQIYQDYARNLFANQPNQFAEYQGVGNYLYDQFDQFRNTSAASGMRDMNTQLARQGIRPGSTGYDRLLNANRITNNLAPAFMNTTNAIGRDYNAINNNRMNDVMLRLGMASDDVLTGYQDRIIARPLDVADERMREINNQIGTYMNLSDAYNQNIAGYQTEETNDFSKIATVLDNFANGMLNGYGGYGGTDTPSSNAPRQFTPANQGTPVPMQANPYTSAGNATASDAAIGQGASDSGMGGAAASAAMGGMGGGAGGYSSYYGGG